MNLIQEKQPQVSQKQLSFEFLKNQLGYEQIRIFYEKWLTAIQKLNDATIKIMQHPQNQYIKGGYFQNIYPFIYQFGNQLLIHLGPIENQIEQKTDNLNTLTQLAYQKWHVYTQAQQLIINQSEYQLNADLLNQGVLYDIKIEPKQEEYSEKLGDELKYQGDIELAKNSHQVKVTRQYMKETFEKVSLYKVTNLEEEKNKLHDRYRARQLGNVIKRIRKSHKEVIKDIQEGKDPKETKNIPKNYAKAIMTFLLKNSKFVERLVPDPELRVEFMKYLQTMKLAIQNIKQFKAMLQESEIDVKQQEFNRVFRIASYNFLNNNAIAYIFHSRITQESWHIKYRNDLLRAVRMPCTFKKVKPNKMDTI